MLEGVIGRDGRVRIVRVERENDPAFTRACIRATEKWRHEPARDKDGRPLAMWSKFVCNATIH